MYCKLISQKLKWYLNDGHDFVLSLTLTFFYVVKCSIADAANRYGVCPANAYRNKLHSPKQIDSKFLALQLF